MKKLNVFSLLSFIYCLFFVTACSESHQTCNTTSTCPMPVADNAAPELQKLRTDLSGKWKFVRVNTYDTIHKVAGVFNELRANMCVSYNGNIEYYTNNEEHVCTFCYALLAKPTATIDIDKNNLSRYCQELLKSGDVKIVGDSLFLTARDSFTVKKFIYRRTNEDGSFK